MNIKNSPVSTAEAEWGNKNALLMRYEGLTRPTLNRWLAEMRSNRLWRDYIVNPTCNSVFVNFVGFDNFLYWKTHGYTKKKAM